MGIIWHRGGGGRSDWGKWDLNWVNQFSFDNSVAAPRVAILPHLHTTTNRSSGGRGNDLSYGKLRIKIKLDEYSNHAGEAANDTLVP